MTLSIGKYLRQTRESRNMTLDQLAQATRVRLIYLRALESDEPSLLPSVVQARGYLRLIANALEIDSKPLLNAYPDKPVILPEADAATPLAESETIAAPSSEVTGTIPPIDESPVESAVESQPFALPEALSIEPPPPPEGSSSFIFAHLGRQLRSQRETLGISLEDAERFTRLKARYLQAIEEGRLEHLPSLVQGRGMLRNYSHFLNLNSDLILDQFAEGLQQRRVELSAPVAPVAADNTPQKTRKRLPSTPIWRRYITPDLLIGAMLFLVLAVFVVWGTARVSDLQGLDSSPTAPSISELLINDTAQPGLIETTPPPQNFAATGDIDAPRQNIAPESGEVLPTEIIPPNNDPVQVYIVANQRTWMRVSVDNQVVFDGRTVPGSAYPFTGRESIELISGNGAGIEVIHNQNNLGLLGSAGEVVRLIFTAQGTVLPTPLFTETPAPTPLPTETPRPTPTRPTPTVTPLIP